METKIRFTAVKKSDMDKVDFNENLYWLDESEYVRVAPLTWRLDSLPKRLSNIIDSGKKIIEGKRVPCIVKQKTILRYLEDEKNEVEGLSTLKDYVDVLNETIDFMNNVQEDEYIIIRI